MGWGMRACYCLLIVVFGALSSSCSDKVMPEPTSSKAVIHAPPSSKGVISKRLRPKGEKTGEPLATRFPKIGDSRDEIIRRWGEPAGEITRDSEPSPSASWSDINGFSVQIIWHGNRVGWIKYHKVGGKLSEEDTHELVSANCAGLSAFFTGLKKQPSVSFAECEIYASYHRNGDFLVIVTRNFFQIRAQYNLEFFNRAPTSGIRSFYKPVQKFTSSDGDGADSNRVNGTLSRFRADGGKKYETSFKDGKQHGSEIWWYSDENKFCEATYENGKRQGLVTWWHANGKKKSEVNHKDDRKHGLETQWDEEGNIAKQTKWEDGVIVR